MERQIVRPWTEVAPNLSKGWTGWAPENLPFQVLPIPWDSRNEYLAIVRDVEANWRITLNLYMGLELPLDESRPLPKESIDELEFELIENTSGNADIFGVHGGGIDPLHNALLIVCGTAAQATNVPSRKAVRCANLAYYMATAMCVGDQEEIENRLRALSGEITLQDAVKAIFDRFDLAHPPSVEWSHFEHRDIWL